jgi:tetratricopeptide (TPR) repeat protein
MISRQANHLVLAVLIAGAALMLLALAAAWPQLLSNAVEVEAARAVFEQRQPAAWTQSSARSPGEHLILAEALAAGGNVTEAQAQYRTYLGARGDARPAMLRLEQVAALGHWCTQRPQDALTLAATLAESPAPALLLAAACQTNGEYDAAIAGLRSAYTAAGAPEVALALAAALFTQTQAGQLTPDVLSAHYAEIAAVLENLPRTELDGKTLYQLGWSQWQLGKFDAAIADYDLCTTKTAEPRYALNCALNLGYGYSAWLPEDRRDLTTARRYFSLAEALLYDEASRREVEAARNSLPD